MAGTGDVPVVSSGIWRLAIWLRLGRLQPPVAREIPVNGATDEIAATGAPDAGAVVNDVSPGAGAGATVRSWEQIIRGESMVLEWEQGPA
ncbi:hypothetical protein DFH11DRAFT_1734464 [Phellopilus nigrolimitatus]|nr:hypothetical protein DFH11DRAFT_1734464 [Phellopilus nigrolimitatus]